MMKRKMNCFKDRLEEILHKKQLKRGSQSQEDFIEFLLDAEVKLLKDAESSKTACRQSVRIELKEQAKPLEDPSKHEKRKVSTGGSTLDDVCEEIPKPEQENKPDSSFSFFQESQGHFLAPTYTKVDQGFSDLLSGLDFPDYLPVINKQEHLPSRNNFEDFMDQAAWDTALNRQQLSLASKDSSLLASADRSFGLPVLNASFDSSFQLLEF